MYVNYLARRIILCAFALSSLNLVGAQGHNVRKKRRSFCDKVHQIAPYAATGIALYSIHSVAGEMSEFLHPDSRDAAALKASYLSLMAKSAGSSVAAAYAAYGFTRNYYVKTQNYLVMRFWTKIDGLEKCNSQIIEKAKKLTTMLQLRIFCMQGELYTVRGANAVLKEALKNTSKVSESKQSKASHDTTLRRRTSPRKVSPSKRRR